MATIGVLFAHEDDVGLPEFPFPELDPKWREKDGTELFDINESPQHPGQMEDQ